MSQESNSVPSKPSLSFSGGKVGVNTACVKRLYEVDYVQFLVNPLTKTLAIRPCSEDAKDAFLWCNERKGKRIPRTITCRLFFAKIAELMGWNPNYRYKMLGKIIKSIDEYLIIFDLTATEVYQRIEREGAKPKMSRTPIFPIEWKDQFGLPVVVHTQKRKKHFELYSIGLTRTIHQVWNELEDGGKHLIEGHLIEPSHILCFHVNDALKEEKE